jgi:cytochrome b561
MTVRKRYWHVCPAARTIARMHGTETSTDTANSRYSATAIVLHWLLGLALVVSFCVGLYMVGLPLSPQRLKLYNWHKWAGVTIFTLSFVRLAWRLTHKPPAALPMATWQQRTANAAHQLLYVLFLAVPLVGWAYSSAAGFPVVVFGVLPLPDLVAADKAVAEAIKPWHAGLAWTMAVVVAVHIAAALKHQFVDRDDILSRMSLQKP